MPYKNVFDSRTLTQEEIKILKIAIESGVQSMLSIQTYKESMKDTVRSAAERLNDGYDDKDMKIKPALINKMIRAKYKDDLQEARQKVDEVETGLQVVDSN